MFLRAAALSIFTVFALSQGVIAALPKDVVTKNDVLIAEYNIIHTAVNALSTSSPPPTVISTSQVCRRLQYLDYHRSSQRRYKAMQATPPFTDSQAAPVVASLANYVTNHQHLMAALIGKHLIFAQFAVTAPIASALRGLEASIDSFSFGMISLIPTRTSEVNQDKNALDTSVAHTINIYDQVCIPSPLYPTVKPVCADAY